MTIDSENSLTIIKEKIFTLMQEKNKVLLAIDGRSGAGKSTLAEKLAEEFFCPVIHMDDFFLRPHQKTKERLRAPGENVDHERFLEEVILPLKEQRVFSYQPCDCHAQDFKGPIVVEKSSLVMVEGSYSCHPKLWEYYDLHLFLDITPEEQMKRIIRRNGEKTAKVFQEKWIPLEEKYFEYFKIKQKCDMVLEQKASKGGGSYNGKN